MKKILMALAALSASHAPAQNPSAPEGYQLEKVVMLSRHGIRAPLIGFGSVLAESTPHTWPEWQTEGGHLTPKGAKLEEIFAAYLDGWFDRSGLIQQEECPNDQVLVYTNSLPRTIDSGKAFVQGAFPACDVTVHHLEDVGKMDNTFNPIVRSAVDDVFVAKAEQSVDEALGEGGLAGLNGRLADAYAALEAVLDYDNSLMCKEKNRCEWRKDDNTLSYEQGKEPKTQGALRNATGAGDSFILQYYEGFNEKDIAFGNIKDADTWQKVLAPKNTYNDVLFGTQVMAKEAAAPLLTFIQNAFADKGYDHPLVDEARTAKVVMLVGHDSNVGSLLPLLQTEAYTLPGQYEHTPISGKVALQKWRDKDGNALLKMEYIYQTGEDLRNAALLDENHPPQIVTLRLKGCKADAQGFCPWQDFESVMESALKP